MYVLVLQGNANLVYLYLNTFVKKKTMKKLIYIPAEGKKYVPLQ